MHVTLVQWDVGTPDDECQIIIGQTPLSPYISPTGLGGFELSNDDDDPFFTVHFLPTEKRLIHKVEDEDTPPKSVFVGIPELWKGAVVITALTGIGKFVIAVHATVMAPSILWSEYLRKDKRRAMFITFNLEGY